MATKGKILIVDDDADSRWALGAALGDHGIEVVEAADGLEAIELLGGVPRPALVITDLEMPRMGGAELIRCARGELGLSIPFVVFSGRVAAADAPRLGADACFAKLDGADMIAHVRKLMAA